MEHYPITNLDPEIIKNYFQSVPKPPEQLFMRGTFPTDNHLVFLTVVGSRNHTPYGKRACQHLISGLRGYPIVIVSGLAQGIDAIAHEAALDAGLLTISFPGSSLYERDLFPKFNLKLATRILESGGCLLSEYPKGFSGQHWMFPERNRLMAGISQATLIIEATHKSGSRITTKLATEYNRDVLAVPGEIFTPVAEGPNELIRLGATPITSPQELLQALGFSVGESIQPDLFSSYDPDEQKVLTLLAKSMKRDVLIRELAIPVHQANILLGHMEIKGLIKEEFGEVRRC